MAFRSSCIRTRGFESHGGQQYFFVFRQFPVKNKSKPHSSIIVRVLHIQMMFPPIYIEHKSSQRPHRETSSVVTNCEKEIHKSNTATGVICGRAIPTAVSTRAKHTEDMQASTPDYWQYCWSRSIAAWSITCALFLATVVLIPSSLSHPDRMQKRGLIIKQANTKQQSR